MNYARDLDLQDRYLNSKSAKYQLRADQIVESIKTVELFTKVLIDINNKFDMKKELNPVVDLTEMQCFWFLTESAEAHKRSKNYCMALKFYYKIDKIFTEVFDDQFDFHSYSIRKCILRAYKDLIKFEDELHDHPYFKRAALGMISTFLAMHQEEIDALSNSFDELAICNQNKIKLEEISKKMISDATAAAFKLDPTKDAKLDIDSDPLGLKYLKVDKLSEALKFAQVVTKYSPGCIEGWIATCQIYIAKGNLSMIHHLF